MKEQINLPPSLIVENKVGLRRGVLFILALFVLLNIPWLINRQELYRQEGVFAAISVAYSENMWGPAEGITAKAHGVILSDAWPLYPVLVSQLYRWMPMENALRIVSLTMLGILALLAGISTAMRSNGRAGMVAGCCCIGTLFAMDKGVYGGPETMAACFLFSAQLLFFHYGSRYADWNSAWISAAVFLSLGFLTAGPIVILFFVFPLIFLRRPLSFAGKFRTPGFLAGSILLFLVVLSWLFPFGMNLQDYTGESSWQIVSAGRYFREILTFPLLLPVYLLPWVFLMWMPFCVALQSISPVPVFSRYLRTLFFSMLALAWLIPGASSSLVLFLLGPLSVLTGLNYELGVRRYGSSVRKLLIFCGFFFPAAVLTVLGVIFLPENWLEFFCDPAKMIFRYEKQYFYTALSAIAVLTVLGFFYALGHRRFPVWVQVGLLCFGIGVFNAVEILPYRMMNDEWRTFGEDVRKALPSDAARIYKYDIDGMYCGLFYVKVPVFKLQQLDQLDKMEDTVYLISSGVPVYPDRVWTSLLPEGYTCKGVEVSVWRGVRRADEDILAVGDE